MDSDSHRTAATSHLASPDGGEPPLPTTSTTPPVSAYEAAIGTRFSDLTLEQLRQLQLDFVTERSWSVFHTPRNLTLALTAEVGELCELFQWRGEVEPGLPGWTDRERERVGEELSDVLLYLVRLSDVCGVDLSAAVLRKRGINADKYPAERVRGRSDKYDQYDK